MRDARSLILLLVSLLLVLVSFILLWTWGYRFYNKNDEFKVAAKIVVTDSNALANRIRDSLQKEYNETLYKLDTKLDSTLYNSDSLKKVLDSKLSEFFRLRNEITTILNKRNNNYADFGIAKKKIGELQTKVDDLKEKAGIVDTENKKLDNILDQEKKSDIAPVKNNNPGKAETNVPVDRNSPAYSIFTASEMKLSAITVSDDKESETSVAGETNKLVGAFTVTNNNSQLSSAEVVVVVVQPDGRVLKNSEWESGSFNTPDGKKIYSYKLNFSYSKGEPKHLYFSLKADKYQKGNYTMQVYYNGTMIGKIFKTLS